MKFSAMQFSMMPSHTSASFAGDTSMYTFADSILALLGAVFMAPILIVRLSVLGLLAGLDLLVRALENTPKRQSLA